MKLSDAMLKGCEMTPQCKGVLWDENGATCALGAAMVGILGREILEQDQGEFAAWQVFPVLHKHINLPGFTVADWIISLNDSMSRSREEIAAWLAEQGL